MNRSVQGGRALAMTAGLALASGSASLAADRHWRMATNGDWQVPSNWQEFTFPGVFDRAVFILPGTYAVMLTDDTSNASVLFAAGNVTVNLNTYTMATSAEYVVGAFANTAAAHTITNGTLQAGSVLVGSLLTAPGTMTLDGGAVVNLTQGLSVGQVGLGTLNVPAGTMLNSIDGAVGQTTTGTGVVNVTGSGEWVATGIATIGGSGDATLNVTGGGSVTALFMTLGQAATAEATVLVDGAGSQIVCISELEVGDTGDAEMTVSAGGAVRTAQGSIGVAPGGMGLATITGAGSTWTMSGALQVGLQAPGELRVQSGATASVAAPGFIGVFAGGDGHASVSGGSQLTFNGQLQVGRETVGSLEVSAGGAATCNSTGSASGTGLILGLQGQGDGTVVIGGAGSTLTCSPGAAVVGWSATGSMEITDGAVVTSDGGYVGRLSGSAGGVTISGAGARWASSQPIRVGLDSMGAEGGNGRLTVLNGGVAQAPSILVGQAGRIEGSGVISGPVTNAGTASPGASPGTLSINGSYTQAATGKLRIDINGTAPGAFDVLAATGLVGLAGGLEIVSPPGFNPPEGATFTIVTGASRAGMFTSVTSSILAGGRRFVASYTPTSVTVTPAPGCLGDANGDGTVNFMDLNIVLTMYGQTGAGLTGDVDGDGVVGFTDLNIVLFAFGTSC